MAYRLGLILTVLACLIVGCDSDDESAGGGTWWEAEETPAHWWMSVINTDTQRIVVGGSPEAGVILRDGGDGVLSVVDHGHSVGLLNWVHAFSDGSFVAVGYDGAVLKSDDGLTWEMVELETDQRMWGVWGASADDVWAVGGR